MAISPTKATAPTAKMSSGVFLQRKCGCGACKDKSPEDEKRKKKGQLQRYSRSASTASDIPQTVHDVLSRSGDPLPQSVRDRLEPSFGTSFANVRVHTDTAAAASSRAVDARAYTVGNQVVFGAGEFNPHATSGLQLLAHELSHVQQQAGNSGESSSKLTINNSSTLERAADTAATAAVSNESVPTQVRGTAASGLQRACKRPKSVPIHEFSGINRPLGDDKEVIERVLTEASAAEKLTPTPSSIQTPISEPTPAPTPAPRPIATSTATNVPSPGPTAIPPPSPIPTGAPAANSREMWFVLHDMASKPTKPLEFYKQRGETHSGALGIGESAGVWVFVDANGISHFSRGAAFEDDRPAVTHAEKSLEKTFPRRIPRGPLDIIGMQCDRDRLLARLWNMAKQRNANAKRKNGATASERGPAGITDKALDEATSDKSYLGDESDKEKKNARDLLEYDFATKNCELEKDPAASTTAIWVGRSLCKGAMAAEKECKTLRPVFEGFSEQTRTHTNVEIEARFKFRQDRDRKKKEIPPSEGYAEDQPDPKNIYSEAQYNEVACNYLRAALAAGVWPRVTSHLTVDDKYQNHHDPRCFNVTRLYEMIAGMVGHKSSTKYGGEPYYVTKLWSSKDRPKESEKCVLIDWPCKQPPANTCPSPTPTPAVPNSK